MVRPDIDLAVVVEGAVHTTMRIGLGELGVDVAAVEEVGIGIAALGRSALAKREVGAAKLVIPLLAAKAVGVPAPDAAPMGLVHG